MTRPLLYLAGPYTTPDPIANTHRATRTASAVYRHTRWAPIIPHLSLLWHLVDPQPYQSWLDYDLHVLAHCDALVRLPGESNGADAEVEFATQRKIEVVDFEHLPYAVRDAWGDP